MLRAVRPEAVARAHFLGAGLWRVLVWGVERRRDLAQRARHGRRARCPGGRRTRRSLRGRKTGRTLRASDAARSRPPAHRLHSASPIGTDVHPEAKAAIDEAAKLLRSL